MKLLQSFKMPLSKKVCQLCFFTTIGELPSLHLEADEMPVFLLQMLPSFKIESLLCVKAYHWAEITRFISDRVDALFVRNACAPGRYLLKRHLNSSVDRLCKCNTDSRLKLKLIILGLDLTSFSLRL